MHFTTGGTPDFLRHLVCLQNQQLELKCDVFRKYLTNKSLKPNAIEWNKYCCRRNAQTKAGTTL